MWWLKWVLLLEILYFRVWLVPLLHPCHRWREEWGVTLHPSIIARCTYLNSLCHAIKFSLSPNATLVYSSCLPLVFSSSSYLINREVFFLKFILRSWKWIEFERWKKELAFPKANNRFHCVLFQTLNTRRKDCTWCR